MSNLSQQPAVRVVVVIPVYRDLAATQRCLSAVLANTPPELCRVVLVEDASPEQALVDWCRRQVDAERVELLHNPENLGFVGSVNRGMRHAGSADVVLLNSDTEVPPGWLHRLQRCAYESDRVATVTPFSNNATICSYPLFCQAAELPEGMSLSALDDLFAEANAGSSLELPTCVGFCVYIRRDALDDLGLFDEQAFGRGYGEENDFSRRAVARGWSNRLCADLFVYHQGGVSFGEDSQALMASGNARLVERFPDYPDIIADFVADDPLQAFRNRVDQLRLVLPGQAEQVLKDCQREQQRLQSAARDSRQQALMCRDLGLEIDRLREALQQLEQRCAAYERYLAEAREYGASTDAALARVQEELRACLATRDQAFEELAEANRRLQDIYNSRVWRYTAWLRKESS